MNKGDVDDVDDAGLIVDTNMAQALSDIKDMVHSLYWVEDNTFVDYILALVLANRFDAEPLWGFVVGPPSSLKTQFLSALRGCAGIKFLSTLTPQTLISGWNTKSGKNCSLLPKLGGKVVVIKEFTTVLQMRAEWRQEVFSQLREIYDGCYTKAFGTGDIVDWEGKIGIIAAVTPEIERHTAVNRVLGERFLYYRIEVGDRYAIAACSRENTARVGDRGRVLRDRVRDMVDLMNGMDVGREFVVSPAMGVKLDSLAVFVSLARTPVIRDHFDRGRVEVHPQPEGPGRISHQLTLLGYSLAAIQGKLGIDDEVYGIIRRIALSLLPPRRLKLLRFLYKSKLANPDQHYSAEVIGTLLNIPAQTCRYDLEDICMINLGVNRTSKVQVSKIFTCSTEVEGLIKSCEIFDG